MASYILNNKVLDEERQWKTEPFFLLLLLAQSSGAVEYTGCIFAEEENNPNVRLVYDTK